ncbi:hypothetical protein OIO90_002082 [Microbotryomycetes sp. JL221]|nr:hypothetical protein OIO90_002082 [Microbotryomycetes sp. JL221]
MSTPLSAGRWINVWVQSPGTHSERKIGTDMTVAQLKAKLEPITGISVNSQRVLLCRADSAASSYSNNSSERPSSMLASLDDESRTLDSYGIKEWMTIKVESTDASFTAAASQFTDLSQVEKYEMSDKDYEARSDSLLNFKKRHHLGRFAPASSENMSQDSSVDDKIPDEMKPGARCQVALSDEMTRRGTIRFVGTVEFGPRDDRFWVGIEWDEPVGKNDGAVEGKRYYQTGPMRASFVRPDKVTVGDFPELDPFADEDDMEM